MELGTWREEKKEKYYPTINGYLSFKDCQTNLFFHSENIVRAGFDTAFLKNRIESIESLLRLLKKYEIIAESLKKGEPYDNELYENGVLKEMCERHDDSFYDGYDDLLKYDGPFGNTHNNYNEEEWRDAEEKWAKDERNWRDTSYDSSSYDEEEEWWDSEEGNEEYFTGGFDIEWDEEEGFFSKGKKSFQLKCKNRARKNSLFIRRRY